MPDTHVGHAARATCGGPVRIAAGSGMHAGRDDYIVFARPGMGVGISLEKPFRDDASREVYRRAGVTPSDIDALYLYDSFTPNVWMTLERFGFCDEGEAWRYIAESGLDLTRRCRSTRTADCCRKPTCSATDT